MIKIPGDTNLYHSPSYRKGNGIDYNKYFFHAGLKPAPQSYAFTRPANPATPQQNIYKSIFLTSFQQLIIDGYTEYNSTHNQ